MEKDKIDIERYYDSVAGNYYQQYQKLDIDKMTKYPQNYLRLQILLKRLVSLGIKSIYEVGTGEGTPLATMAKMGFEVAGCDISERMVEETRKRLGEINEDTLRVQWGDIEDSLSMAGQVKYAPFDAVIAFGVMPHVGNDLLAIKNMKMLLKRKGRVFIEFRNKLFSLFTFNRYTKEFIINDLLADVSHDIKEEVGKELDKRLAIDEPPVSKDNDSEGIQYGDIKAKFHNPFEVQELLKSEDFEDIDFHWYHYHPAPPMLEKKFQKLFWEDALRLEHNSSNWRGYFLCSAFFVEASLKG